MAAASSDEPPKIGAGRVVLVVGPSGAGKDTLIRLARGRLGTATNVLFPKRHVTRASDATEDVTAMTPAEFQAAAAAGRFALHWQAHDTSYGIGSEVDALVAGGATVVLNVSRAAVNAARLRYRDVVVVYVDAPVELRAARLASRGREALPALQSRLAGAASAFRPQDADVTIINDDTPETASDRLYAVISNDVPLASPESP